jgi:hypothetical protein
MNFDLEPISQIITQPALNIANELKFVIEPPALAFLASAVHRPQAVVFDIIWVLQ